MNENTVSYREKSTLYARAGSPFGRSIPATLIWWTFKCYTRLN